MRQRFFTDCRGNDFEGQPSFLSIFQTLQISPYTLIFGQMEIVEIMKNITAAAWLSKQNILFFCMWLTGLSHLSRTWWLVTALEKEGENKLFQCFVVLPWLISKERDRKACLSHILKSSFTCYVTSNINIWPLCVVFKKFRTQKESDLMACLTSNNGEARNSSTFNKIN